MTRNRPAASLGPVPVLPPEVVQVRGSHRAIEIAPPTASRFTFGHRLRRGLEVARLAVRAWGA